MTGRYLTPVSVQLAYVQTLFEMAKTVNTCSQAVLSVQSHWWQQARRGMA